MSDSGDMAQDAAREEEREREFFAPEGQPQPQPDRETWRKQVASAIIDAAWDDGPHPDSQTALRWADALLPLLGQPQTDAPKPDTVNVGGLHVAPEMEAMLRASLDIHGVKQPPRTDAPLDPEPWEYGIRNTVTGAVGYPWDRDSAIRSTVTEGWPFEPVRRRPASEWETFEQVQARYPRTDTGSGREA